MRTAYDLTDDDIRNLRDGEIGLLDESIRDLCRVALQSGTPTKKHPFCNVCGWRRVASIRGTGAHASAASARCRTSRATSARVSARCPTTSDAQPCPSCDGSGLIEPGARVLARARVAEILNARVPEEAL